MKKLFLFIFFLPLISLNINAAQLTVSEVDLLVQQLSSCWNIQSGLRMEKDMFVKISAEIYQNKRVEVNSVRIVDTNISKNNPLYRPITEAAMRIFYNPKCIPLYLPTDKYDLWKYLTVTLDFNFLYRYQKNTAAKDDTIVYCKNTYSNLYSKKDWHCSSGEIQITFKEYNSKIIKKDFGIKIQKDLEGPSIIVVNTFQADNQLVATIKGRIIDSSEVVSLLIDGDIVSMDPWKGTFNKKIFVKPGGQDVKIIAIDQHGNISEETVKLVRAPSTQVAKIEPKKTTTETQIVKQEQTVVVEKDIIGPEIIVKDTFTTDENLTATVRGRVKDDSDIASLIIDGDQVSFMNGNFSQSLYVTEDREVIIAAIDKYGNKTDKIVLLKRGQVQPVAVKFEPLDPRKIKSKINNSAVALIIGIEDYENTFKAAYAKKDAQIFHDFAHQAFGVPFYNIKLLTNTSAKRNDTLKTMASWLPKVIKENKTDFYLFFSGHGLASDNGEDLFLLPFDGYPELLEDSTLLRNRIFQDISKLNPKSVTVFLDTCYSGATRSEEFLVAAKPIFIEVAEQEIPNNFTVFSASAGKETAKILEEAEHGLFSYYMMKGLEGDADSNSDNQITNGELIAFISKNVSRQANQTPQLNGDPDQVLVQW